MMPMAAARRRADDFAAAVDGRASVGIDAEMRAFLALIEQLREVQTPVPDPAFAADLRTRLVAAARDDLVAAPVQRAPSRARSIEPRRRRVASIAASACIVAGSGMGVAAASQSALPGDALYPVKRGIENVGVSIAASPASRGHEYVDAASARLAEARALAVTRADDPSTSVLIASTLADFTLQAHEAAQQLLTAYQQNSSPESIAELRAFAGESALQVQLLGQTVPSDVRDDLLVVARALTRIDAAARDACPTCSTLAPITLSGEFSALREEAAHRPAVQTPAQPVLPRHRHRHHHPTATASPQHSPQHPQATQQLPTTVATPGSQHQPRHHSQQVPTPTVITPPPADTDPSQTEFTAPPMTGSSPPSIADETPTVSLPTKGLGDLSDAVPQVLDAPAPELAPGATLPLP